MWVRRSALSFVAAILITAAALNTEAQAQAANWTFGYGGAFAGYDWNNVDIDGAGSIEADGAAGGILGGYNFYQSGSLVLGVEADIMWINGSGDLAGAPPPIVAFTVTEPFPLLCSLGNVDWRTDVNWKASLRGRAGWLATPTTLIYGTAGVAWADVDLSAQGNCSGSESLSFVGGVFGGGIETLLGSNLYGRVEVLSYVFDDETFSIQNPPFLEAVTTNIGLDETVARVALVLRLN